jgi:hypothetical protein
MMGKRLFWREFWVLWTAGAITSAIFAALVRIPTTPFATFLLLRGHSQKPLLVGTEAIEIIVGLAIAVSCGLLAAHRIGLGAPIVEKWLCGETIESQVRGRGDITCRNLDAAQSFCVSSQSRTVTSAGRENL